MEILNIVIQPRAIMLYAYMRIDIAQKINK